MNPNRPGSRERTVREKKKSKKGTSQPKKKKKRFTFLEKGTTL